MFNYIRFPFFILLLFLFSCSGEQENQAFLSKKSNHPQTLQSGDLIFQSSQSSQCKAVQLATHSVYSHCGIIYVIKGKTMVYEAVQPVKLTDFNDWIKRGKDEKYVVKRLKEAEKILSPDVLKKMQVAGEQYAGKDYDLFFEWSDDRIYCSELLWKIYKNATGIEIGKLQKLKDFDLTSAPVRQKLKERYGDIIPIEETVISPAGIFNSDLLITVKEN
jgi:uncharacterized protein YycO